MDNIPINQHLRNMSIMLQMLMYPFEAESAAYVICSHYGIDTSSYSFGQIAKWSEDKELKELKDNLKYIKEISSEIMKKLDETIAA